MFSRSSLARPFVCARCLRHQRVVARRTYAAIAALPHRKLLSLSGPDAPKFLQGLTTNNVPSAAQNPGAGGWYTAFLNAQGRVLYDAFVYPNAHLSGGDGNGWACFIEVDASCLDGLRMLLKRHKLRSKVTIVPVEDWGVWSAWRDNGDTSIDVGAADNAKFIHLADERVPAFGHRLLLPLSAAYLSSSSSSTSSSSITAASPPPNLPPQFQDLPVAMPGAYAVRRYLNGLAEGPAEMRPGEALPLESNVDVMRGVDFRKGCYVGQELTIRTKHTGVVRKRILPVRLYDLAGEEPQTLEFDGEEAKCVAGLVPPAADIMKVAGADGENTGGPKKGRSAGRWLDGVGNVGLALCRLEMMTDVKVGPEPTAAGGYKPGMRFAMKWVPEGQEAERSMGVKAFVPEWHQRRMDEEAELKGKRKNAVQNI
ncbi:uncharacterized protein K452DRAFT_290384 [Aplosporella prunicola CBS 121167]|uniref:Iron-sulfur cluster assembly factor IBA57 homolog, mitochondrial n=1 Tax=Aplosporella prunicola CBS 121167 TaxID=1176127 RepID=A0A6A6B5M8_9PEZI|nr:uncharacterized protein K452DRAFT_290384 [Aplosporella prunicola CBS 121167]KAF2138733.1 hypothetical protein K452DRAFT_290384 [Aplosporella prunicola CBS 121167]